MCLHLNVKYMITTHLFVYYMNFMTWQTKGNSTYTIGTVVACVCTVALVADADRCCSNNCWPCI